MSPPLKRLVFLFCGLGFMFLAAVNEIKNVSRSYKEAKMALEVGKIFYAEKNVIPYNNLGIGRLIYQLPIPLCEMFMKEVFGEHLPGILNSVSFSCSCFSSSRV